MEILGLGLTILANCAKFYDTPSRYKASNIKLDKDSIHSSKGCSIAAAADGALFARSLSLSLFHCPLLCLLDPASNTCLKLNWSSHVRANSSELFTWVLGSATGETGNSLKCLLCDDCDNCVGIGSVGDSCSQLYSFIARLYWVCRPRRSPLIATNSPKFVLSAVGARCAGFGRLQFNWLHDD